MDGGAWWAAVHGVAKSQTPVSDFTFAFHFHALEKEMATHSSVLAWRIPGPGAPGGLPSMGSHRVRHDWSNVAGAVVVWSRRGAPKPWQGHGTREESERQLLITQGCPRGPIYPLRSRRDKKGICRATLPLEVVPGAWYVPFFFLSYCWAFY